MDALVWYQGKILKPEDARVSVFDRGFLFGDGVYETGRSYGRAFLYVQEHWKRMRRSAEKLAITIPWSDEELSAGLFATARAFNRPDLYFRTIVTRGVVESVGLEAAVATPPTLVHLVQPLPASSARYRAQGIRLVTSTVRRNPPQAQDPNIKTSNYLNSLLALQDAIRRGGEDAVLCDANGVVAEGTTFSLFGVHRDGRLLTPSLAVGILDSLTRRHVLELARGDFKIEEGFFPLADFKSCAEVFLVSSVRDITPVVRWDETEYPVPGPTTRTLAERLAARIETLAKSAPTY